MFGTWQPLEVSAGARLSDFAASEIRAHMARFSLKQIDLAETLGVTQAHVSRKLRGVTPFTLDELQVIADWFSTTPPVLLGYATEPRPRKPERGSARCAARDSNPEPSD